jgi:hypothetical protein
LPEGKNPIWRGGGAAGKKTNGFWTTKKGDVVFNPVQITSTPSKNFFLKWENN